MGVGVYDARATAANKTRSRFLIRYMAQTFLSSPELVKGKFGRIGSSASNDRTTDHVRDKHQVCGLEDLLNKLLYKAIGCQSRNSGSRRAVVDLVVNPSEL